MRRVAVLYRLVWISPIEKVTFNQILGCPSYRKTQTNFLANPILERGSSPYRYVGEEMIFYGQKNSSCKRKHIWYIWGRVRRSLWLVQSEWKESSRVGAGSQIRERLWFHSTNLAWLKWRGLSGFPLKEWDVMAYILSDHQAAMLKTDCRGEWGSR